MRTKGSILVGVLWCLALLSVVVVGVLHTARLDLFVVKNYGDRIQAHYLALAGIENAKALLYRDSRSRRSSRTSHSGELFNSPQTFRNVSLGRGHFQVFRRGRSDEGGGIIYGVMDEESRLNVNNASHEELSKLVGMTPDIVAAILDWRDDDNEVSPSGAEAEYYASLQPPGLPRNGPLQTVRELLMVRGISKELLLGNDLDQNGLLASAGDEPENPSADNGSSVMEDAGWSASLTVDSSVKNLNAAGEDRVNVQTADEAALTAVKGITPEIAKSIVAYRGKTELKSVADLLDVTTAANQNASGPRRNAGNQDNSAGDSANSPKAINDTLLMDIADDVTAGQDAELPGVININSASLDVLACLPGIDRNLAQAIISYRQSSGFFPNVAWLLKVSGLTKDIFKQIAPRVSAHSETFRVISEGRVDSTGARQRIGAIIHVGLHDVATLSYREDL